MAKTKTTKSTKSTRTKRQGGNTFIGLIIGIVLGLGAALGIAVYVTKVPIPFVSKTQRNTAEQDEAEARRNKDWDPNAPLAGKAGAVKPPAMPAAAPGSSAPTAGGSIAGVTPSTSAPVPVVVAPKAKGPSGINPDSDDPIGDLARARAGGGTQVASAAPSASSGPDPFIYFVQAGAFRSNDDAEAQRAKLSLMGVEAKVTEREQAGRTVYRVRAGPFNKKDDADRLKERLDSGGLETALVRVQR
ncbi:MAG: SPOR domain-containing protein [Proteobacteria bacterium]|nr:SPOR domain-containing protein [Pseudomonadota bacterium]